jgi:hypothetical protein
MNIPIYASFITTWNSLPLLEKILYSSFPIISSIFVTIFVYLLEYVKYKTGSINNAYDNVLWKPITEDIQAIKIQSDKELGLTLLRHLFMIPQILGDIMLGLFVSFSYVYSNGSEGLGVLIISNYIFIQVVKIAFWISCFLYRDSFFTFSISLIWNFSSLILFINSFFQKMNILYCLSFLIYLLWTSLIFIFSLIILIMNIKLNRRMKEVNSVKSIDAEKLNKQIANFNLVQMKSNDDEEVESNLELDNNNNHHHSIILDSDEDIKETKKGEFSNIIDSSNETIQ